MNFVERVVFDTSTLVSSLLLPSSIPRQAFLQAVAQAEFCASAATLAELESVLGRRKFDRYLARDLRLQFFGVYRRHVRFFSVSASDEKKLKKRCRDPRDNKFLALVLACQAAVLVSSDEDLLTLHPYGQIAILSPADYLRR